MDSPDCELPENMFKKIGRAGGTAISPLRTKLGIFSSERVFDVKMSIYH